MKVLTVTENAKQELKRILADNVDHPDAGLRLTSSLSDYFALTIDVAAPDEQVVEYEGSKVLLVDKELSDTLDGDVLDVEDTTEGAALVMKDSDDQVGAEH